MRECNTPVSDMRGSNSKKRILVKREILTVHKMLLHLLLSSRRHLESIKQFKPRGRVHLLGPPRFLVPRRAFTGYECDIRRV